ncbi:hypothetical protein [Halarchaeum sp. P4]|uniref:hypothetical protein n=1 Tax=Halarchaeum sp. P4 TaxID=3421639 RepID=UPI003EBF5616
MSPRLPRLSRRAQLRLTRAMQLLLAGIVAYGLLTRQPKAIVNGALALCVTALPALLERNYRLPLDPWLGLWITLAVFLHTLGSAGLYGAISWWDHLTHAMSASLVAGVGYAVVRAVDLHSDDVRVPRRYMFVFIFVVVLAFATIWELFEYALDVISHATGVTMPLAQHGLDDTVRDLVFNSVGALLVAVFGQTHLSDVAERLRERIGSD